MYTPWTHGADPLSLDSRHLPPYLVSSTYEQRQSTLTYRDSNLLSRDNHKGYVSIMIMKMNTAKGIPVSFRIIKTFRLNHASSSRFLHRQITVSSSHPSPLLPEKNAMSSVNQPQMLNNSHSLLTQDRVYHMLRKSRRHPLQALNIFNWACHKHGLKPGSLLAGQLLRILAKRKTVHYFWDLANKFLEEGCEINSKDYLAIEMNFKRLNMMKDVDAWNNFFKKRRVPTTVSNTIHGLDVVLGLHKKLTHEEVLYVLHKEERNPQKALNLFKWVTEKQGFKPNQLIYGLMLKILANKLTIKEFWDLTKKIDEEGCCIDVSVYLTVLATFKTLEMANDATVWVRFFEMRKNSGGSSIVQGVVDVVSRSDSYTDLVKNLGEVKVALSENVVLGVMKKLHQDPFKALRFFFWVSDYRGYTHNALTYNIILRVLARKKSIKKFWSMLYKMKTVGHDLHIVTYIEITRYLQKHRMMKDAVSLYELMMDGLYKPQVQICTSLLWDILKDNIPDMDLVLRVLRKCGATGLALPKVVYDGLLKSLMGVGRFDEAKMILAMMRNAGYEPDHISHRLIVYGFCKAGRLEEARKAFGEIEAKGWVPDKETWMFLICGYCIAGEIDTGLEYFNKMLEKKVEADRYLLEFMVNGFCSKIMVDSASTLFTKLIRKPTLRPSYFSLTVPNRKS